MGILPSKYLDVIAAPRLVPFNPQPRCPACGDEGVSGWLNFWRSIRGTPPLSTMRVTFCAGGKQPSEPQRHLPTVVIEQLGIPDRDFACAGIMDPHIHLQCGACQYETFMKTKNRIEGV